jgi:hypothetical protein
VLSFFAGLKSGGRFKILFSMKIPSYLGIAGVLAGAFSLSQGQQLTRQVATLPSPTPSTVVSRAANSRVWTQTNYEVLPTGKVVPQTHQYTELASGLCYQQNQNGPWLDSQEQINILPDGSAAATNGQHQVYFPADIYRGAIIAVAPDGNILQSQPVGLSYDDGTSTVLIAELTNSVGQLISTNQVIYTNAFVGLSADLVYTYTKAGFEQDVILEGQPPAPDVYGLNPQTTRLQVITEFLNPPTSAIATRVLPAQAAVSVTDETPSFGNMTMIPGRAFLLGQNADEAQSPVGKQWLSLQGRQFLVEEVPVAAIADQLSQLPQPSQLPNVAAPVSKTASPLNVVSAKRLLPPQRLAKTKSPLPIRVSRRPFPNKGLLLDYQLVNNSQSSFVFQGDTTYLISGTLNFSGTNTFEGGAVIKYASGASINFIPGATVPVINWQAGAYRPVVFTAKDDNSVGETISGSTGNPAGYYANPALNFMALDAGASLSNFRIAYAQQAVELEYGGGFAFYNGQLIDCQNGFYDTYETVYLRNMLFGNVQTNFNNLLGATFDVQNSTFDLSTVLVSIVSNPSQSIGFVFTNCIFSQVFTLTNAYTPGYIFSLAGSENGFFNSPAFGSGVASANAYPFQSAGAGAYYLTNGCPFTNGTANIDPVLLASLGQKTSYAPPIIYTNFTVTNATWTPQVQRDTNSNPNLGFHYDPIDYLVGSITVSGTLTLTNGVAVALFPGPQNFGLLLSGTDNLNSYGIAQAHNQICNYQAAQEEPLEWGPLEWSGQGPYYTEYVQLYFNGNSSSTLTARFTDFDGTGGLGSNGGYSGVDIVGENLDDYPYVMQLYLRDCRVGPGAFYCAVATGSSPTNYICQTVNNLFERTTLTFDEENGNGSLSFFNNEVRNSTVNFENYAVYSWIAENNLFDHSALNANAGNPTNDYNAYLGTIELSSHGGHDVPLTSFTYTNGPLGSYYQFSGGLIQKGSITSDKLGLYEYTTRVSEVPETNAMVDIGYHYVATDPNGNPLDTYVPGIPNYIVDSQGTGMDTNGLSFAWESKYFGALGLNPNFILPGGHTLLFDYQHSITPSSYITMSPLSQDVMYGDTVTFAVQIAGNTNLTFQWIFDGSDIAGATNSSFTVDAVQLGQGGNYACIISNEGSSLVTATAQLTTEYFWDDPLLIPIGGQRQNYTFRSGYTYYIGSPIRLYGDTTIEAGAVLKFDLDYSTNSSLVILGGLTCKTTPYNPAILTSIDDDSVGEYFVVPGGIFSSTGWPETMANYGPYLDLTSTTSNSISNLRFLFADFGVSTPTNTPGLDIWDCQFVNCSNGIVNAVAGNAINSLHNVLFAACGTGVLAPNNSITIYGEQVTADVTDFCVASSEPALIALTNSIVWGSALTASSVVTNRLAMNPDPTNFVSVDEGNYYLAANSPLRKAGTPNISGRLQAEMQGKTTCPPIVIGPEVQISGQMTFSPQAPRYTNGAPDLGFYYDALDYTVATLVLNGGNLNVLPGTAIGFCNAYIPDPNNPRCTYNNFMVYDGGSITGHGTPTKPIIFTAADLAQEEPNTIDALFLDWYKFETGVRIPGIEAFVTQFLPGDPGTPNLDFRFCDFYLPAADVVFGSGRSFTGVFDFSLDSTINLTLRDCNVHNGLIDLGGPDWRHENDIFGNGAVIWVNDLFENVSIDVDTSIYQGNGMTNVDLIFSATNNLFRGGEYFHFEPLPASAGDWAFENNLFDKVDIFQDTGTVGGEYQPLDYDHNAYWPLSTNALAWDWIMVEYIISNGRELPRNTNELQPTVNQDGFVDGQHEVTLAAAPPYQAGPYGNYYLPTDTPLYGAGSDTPANLGLYHYTTRIDQVKEGQDTAKVNANIGLHYIAATNVPGTGFYGPVDTDGDGIPDYVENWNGDGNYSAHVGVETDWTTQHTIPGVWDPTNTVYDNVDLSGDGLAGRIKEALGVGPFCPTNPLILTEVGCGSNNMITFELPISYSVLTNIGKVYLGIDGRYARLEMNSLAPDGNTLLIWNSTYDPPGPHYLQVELFLSVPVGITAASDDVAASPPEVTSAAGSVVPFYSANMVQFLKADSMFDNSGANLDARVAEQNANYTITLYDPSSIPPTRLTTITGSTTDGTIQEDWGVTNADGSAFTGNTVVAVFDVASDDPSAEVLTRPGSMATVGKHDGFDFGYFYTPLYPGLEWVFGDPNGIEGPLYQGMLYPVDQLLTPQETDSGSDNHYLSGFNYYDQEGTNHRGENADAGYPGYIGSADDITDLTNDLTDPNMAVKNIYINGHGNVNIIGASQVYPSLYIASWQIADLLSNTDTVQDIGPTGDWLFLRVTDPFRFVFLDGCLTGVGSDWPDAWGIFPLDTNQPAVTQPQNRPGPQAYVGWGGEGTAWTAGFVSLFGNTDPTESIEQAWSYSQTIGDFYSEWQNGTASLAECINDASQADQGGQVPLSVPPKRTFRIYDEFGSAPVGYQYFNFREKLVDTAQIYVIGHSGLLRYGSEPTFDNRYVSPYN